MSGGCCCRAFFRPEVYTFRALDAFSLPACRALAEEMLKAEAKLDYLVLTHGMATVQAWATLDPFMIRVQGFGLRV